MPANFSVYSCVVLPYMSTNDHGATNIHRNLLDARGAGIVDSMTTEYEVSSTWY